MNEIVVQNRNEQFAEVVSMIQHTRNEVVRLANTSLIDLYWRVGRYISGKISVSEWGDGVVKQLADYIEKNSPEIKGFSDKNLWRMKQFYETYKDADEKLSALLRQISWTNNLTIMSRSKSIEERLFYLQLCVHDRLSTRQLERQINSALYERNAVGNIKLSPVMREIVPQAEQIFRDQYVMEFIGGKEYEHENCMKAALVKQMKRFILELGKDFLFIDEEYRLQVGNSDFRIDLLFYHRELQCLVAFELKMEKFKPEHLGQLNFYLEALDRDVRKPKENPSIGILLCKDKDDTVVEYALSRSLSPTMVAEYQLCLPDKALLQQKLHDIIEQDS
ncbi:MAG: PDDEXK nuclease domain-containing protein [Prevotellaceae bacterium]|nr:PDDEXK nuclease domain-containing protein [Prevotellaceae bacterium]